MDAVVCVPFKDIHRKRKKIKHTQVNDKMEEEESRLLGEKKIVCYILFLMTVAHTVSSNWIHETHVM